MNRQCEEIIRFMKDFGGITSAEAMADLGVYRLASRIHDIRKEGVKIKSETVTSKNRYGTKIHFKRYSMEEE